MISKDDIQRINDAARVEEIVGEFVNLKKRGVNYIGLCPFHNEKTPSFVVSPAKNIYKCFGCGAAGNSVNFIMEHEQYTYPEALRFLAKKYSIEITEQEKSAEDQESENEKQLMFILHELAQKYYTEILHDTDEGKSIGLSYFKSRGFSDQFIEKFGLGYAPDSSNGFSAYAISKGYHHEDLKKAGLAVESNTPSDRFRGRVIFPIFSISGRVLGFGARQMKSNEKSAKYLNSPETLIYHKSHVLYGLHLAKKAILQHDTCLIVEGYTDVISLHQAGVQNVVSSSGTSLTEDQIRLIKRFTPNVTMVFDGDKAGVKASFRGIDMVLEAGMNVRVVMLPENEDPDSFAQANRDKDITAYFSDHAVSFIVFKTQMLSDEAGKDPLKKAAVIQDIVQSVARIQDGITRTLFVRECSTIMDVPENILHAEISKILRKKFTQGNEQVKVPHHEKPDHTQTDIGHLSSDLITYELLENRIAKLLVSFPENEIEMKLTDEEGKDQSTQVRISTFITSSLAGDEFLPKSAFARGVFDFFNTEPSEFSASEIHAWINSVPVEEFRNYLVDLISNPYILSDNWKKELNIEVVTPDNSPQMLQEEIRKTIASYKLYRLQEEYEQLNVLLNKSTDPEEQDKLMTQQKHIHFVMTKIAQLYGIIRLD